VFKLHRVKKKATILLPVTLSKAGRFSKIILSSQSAVNLR